MPLSRNSLLAILDDAKTELLAQRVEVPLFIKDENDLKPAGWPWAGVAGLAFAGLLTFRFIHIGLRRPEGIAVALTVASLGAVSLLGCRVLDRFYRAARKISVRDYSRVVKKGTG